ncbi:hypothetical protein [Noviherbaspirillum sp. ST9]|uniref:hypothetical protein n=1 Tax=Noviherbaspirillum sp. ST9 TaxID=3401606 RepID=UPI003B585BA6
MGNYLKIRAFMRWTALLAVAFALVSCVATSRLINHSFGFDMRKDDQDAEVLDYRYGDSNVLTRADQWRVAEGKPFYAEAISGRMPRGDQLYVKWRILSTGKVFEDAVDLRKRLPSEIEDHKLYFMVEGSQLYVYLISPDLRPKELPPIGPRTYSYRKTIMIYPDMSR